MRYTNAFFTADPLIFTSPLLHEFRIIGSKMPTSMDAKLKGDESSHLQLSGKTLLGEYISISYGDIGG